MDEQKITIKMLIKVIDEAYVKGIRFSTLYVVLECIDIKSMCIAYKNEEK